MAYSIREAGAADEKRIRELFEEMIRTVYHVEDVEPFGDMRPQRFWSGTEDRIFVAEEGGTVVGFLSVEIHDEPVRYAYFDDFSVTGEHRDKGIGTELIRAGETYAADVRASAVLLHVEKSNSAAMRLYERHGYSIYRDEGNRLLMKKDIPQE